MKKNNKVETAKNGQTTANIQPEKVKNALKRIDDIRKGKKDKTPTAEVKSTVETAMQRKKIREENYKNFRINSLRRRARNMKLPEEKIEELVKKLEEQLNEPTTYQILILFSKSEADMVKQALKNAGINTPIITDSHTWIDGDKAVLDKIREIMPTKVKIHPYTKKKPPILEKKIPDKEKKPTNNTSNRKKAAKAARKAINMMKFVGRKKNRGKAKVKLQKRMLSLEKKRQERAKNAKKPSMQMTHKNPSKTLKKASRTMKKAA